MIEELEERIAIMAEGNELTMEPDIEGGGYNWWYVCGECHGNITDRMKYFPWCGRKAVWK